MSAVIFAIAAIVWLVAVYAFVRIIMAWFGVWQVAPAGQKFNAVLELGFWNFIAVQQRLGAAATAHIASYRHGVHIFMGAIAVFMVLVIVNIATGNAA